MKLVIIGAGGHAKVILEAALLNGYSVIGFLDDDSKAQLSNLTHLGQPSEFRFFEHVKAVIAVGSNRHRQELSSILKFRWETIIHPFSWVSPSVQLGDGVVIMAGAVVQSSSVVQSHVIVNTGSRIDHDCCVNAFAHVAPGAVLTGEVIVGEGVLVGAGSIVNPKVCIGDWSVVASGAVLTKDAKSRKLYVGIPARIVRDLENG